MSIHIPLQGTPNFRDLGGYKNTHGKTLVRGKFFRSGVLSGLSDEDLEKLAELNIRTICDFRREEESLRDPTRLQAEKLVLSIDPGSQSKAFTELADHDARYDMAQFMREINAAFALDHVATYKQMLDAVENLEADEALLFHCSAGKDRTGFAAALILSILDVPRNIIMQDYLLTADYFDVDVQLPYLIAKYAQHGFDKVDAEQFRPVLEVRRDYLQAAFDAIDQQYGDTDTYLAEAFGMTESERKQWQRRFML
jgi:protein-tyrosine phosphatase